MSPAAARRLRVAGAVAVAALLIVFVRGVDWRGVSDAMRGARPGLLAAALTCNLLSLLLKGVRWWVLLRPVGVRSLALVLRGTFAGASLNNLMVAQGGEGARVLLVSRASGVSSAPVLAALALERSLDAVSYLALLGGVAWLLPLPARVAQWRPAASAVLGAALAALVVLCVVARRPARGAGRGEGPSYLRRFAGAFARSASPLRVALALLLSLAAWTLQVATYHLVAVAAHGTIPLAGSVAALLSVGISFLVRATPGNVGVFQAVYAVAVHPFGMTEDAAIATALLIQAVQVVPVVVLGTLLTPRLGRGVARDREQHRSEP